MALLDSVRGMMARGAVRERVAGCAAMLLAFAVPIVLLAATPVLAQPPCPPALVDQQRYGFVAVTANWAQRFDVSQLNAGWVVDHRPGGTFPSATDRALQIRVGSGFLPGLETLGALVDANPASLWLIGSEPDSIWNDNLLPEQYARIYHDLYTFIKGRDAMSRVAAGGIVQPTPLRLAYLDRVLAEYQARYGQKLPTDVWQIHNAILNEQRGVWGADIPPGFDEDEGVVRSVGDNDNMPIFRDQVRAFRQWMADRGYGGYPLIITEYGVLMPAEYGFTVTRVNQFMSNTFAFLAAATDPVLGDPADGGRLVQRWAWFSLAVPPWDPLTGNGFNGNLFDPETDLLTAHGLHFASLTAGLPPLSYVDLGISAWHIPAATALASATQPITRPMQLRVANGGVVDSGPFAVELAWSGPAAGLQQASVPGVGPNSTVLLDWTLADLPPGRYRVTATVDVLDEVPEAAECNNVRAQVLIAPSQRMGLPLAAHGAAAGSGLLAGRETGGGAPTGGGLLAGRETVGAAPAGAPAGAADAAIGFVEFELPTPGAYPGQLALDPGTGAVWVTARDANKLARFDPGTGQWAEWDIPTAGSQPWGLAVDSAGDVWFAETAANQIGRWVAASGTIVEHPVPTPASEPWGVAVGGGAVWFTEQAGNRIGRLDPGTGQVVEYVIPTANAGPRGIAAYGDKVWFAETGADRLGILWMGTGQVYDFYTLPHEDPIVSPQDVAVLVPGNPWMTNMGGDAIVLFQWTTLQQFYSIPVPSPASEPYGIDTFDDDAVWFTERAGNRLGRFGREDRVVEYPLPTPGSEPTDIVAIGEDCAWYAAPGSNRIGRFCRDFVYLPISFRYFEG